MTAATFYVTIWYNNAVDKESVPTVQKLGENDCGFFFVFMLYIQVYLFVIP